jgi:Flp pilus assembly protein CpaB
MSANSYMPFTTGKFNRQRKRRTKIEPSLVILSSLGVVCLVFFIGVWSFLSPAKRDEPLVDPLKVVETVKRSDILVPVDTIPVGVLLQQGMFRKELKPEGQITGDMLRGFDELKGVYSRGVLFKGQPVFRSALTNRQPVHVLTAMLPKGYRAVALEVERPWLDNVDGWAQPGTDVDLVWITNVFGRETASILAGPVRVLASNKATEWTPSKKMLAQQDKLVTVTLLLSMRDAVRVSLAAMHGRVSLGLRGLGDQRPVDGARPLSDIVSEEPQISPIKERGILSVRVSDPRVRRSELRRYDLSGRRLSD